MEEILKLKVGGEVMPEHPEVTYETNGWQGGDAGHGGYAKLTFSFHGGVFEVKQKEGKYGLKEIDIIAMGDWEQDGLVYAIIELAEMLKRDKAHLSTFNFWSIANAKARL